MKTSTRMSSQNPITTTNHGAKPVLPIMGRHAATAALMTARATASTKEHARLIQSSAQAAQPKLAALTANGRQGRTATTKMDGMAEATPRRQLAAVLTMTPLLNIGIMAALAALAPIL